MIRLQTIVLIVLQYLLLVDRQLCLVNIVRYRSIFIVLFHFGSWGIVQVVDLVGLTSSFRFPINSLSRLFDLLELYPRNFSTLVVF